MVDQQRSHLLWKNVFPILLLQTLGLYVLHLMTGLLDSHLPLTDRSDGLMTVQFLLSPPVHLRQLSVRHWPRKTVTTPLQVQVASPVLLVRL